MSGLAGGVGKRLRHWLAGSGTLSQAQRMGVIVAMIMNNTGERVGFSKVFGYSEIDADGLPLALTP
jgi:hypothetical protein